MDEDRLQTRPADFDVLHFAPLRADGAEGDAGAAMKMIRGDRTLWDEEDGFFYDILRFSDGSSVPVRVRSLVGLIPLYAIERLEKSVPVAIL